MVCSHDVPCDASAVVLIRCIPATRPCGAYISNSVTTSARRQVWDLIMGCKQEHTSILTTHSMEEAEVLCDTIGIMTAGSLR